MRSMSTPVIYCLFLLLMMQCFPAKLFAQDAEKPAAKKSEFWKHVQFGGALGASFGSGYTDVLVAPSAIYNFNKYFAAGVGLQGSYVKVRNQYDSFLYGGSVIGLFNPIEQIQLSAELEQLRVNTDYNFSGTEYSDNFWNTGLFVGLGFRTQNVTIGARYNLLHDDDKLVYSDAFMPFVRIYF